MATITTVKRLLSAYSTKARIIAWPHVLRKRITYCCVALGSAHLKQFAVLVAGPGRFSCSCLAGIGWSTLTRPNVL
jgi:hypothetical protein